MRFSLPARGRDGFPSSLYALLLGTYSVPVNANQRANKILWSAKPEPREFKDKDYTWMVEGGVAVLTKRMAWSHEQPVRYNEESLVDVIANVKRQRDTYNTDQAYVAAIEMYEEGLMILQTALGRTKK